MKKIITTILLTASLALNAQQPTIIDHNCSAIQKIPAEWIDSAKANLYIGYGHTSHGSQLTSGMNALESFFTGGEYNWSHSGGPGELHLFEGDGYGTGLLKQDCGYVGWDNETRNYLDSFPDCNVIIWSWCGQVNSVDVVNHYLIPMNQLESEYPGVTFVYMTGHLEGLGPGGSLFIANQLIRDYCINNNKVLFDFADIEKYSPECDTNFQQYFADDECYYQHPLGGSANWANDWLTNNPNDTLTQISQLCTSCAHSVSLNCVKKGIACWYLWAKIAGWIESASGIADSYNTGILKLYPNPAKDAFTITLPKECNNFLVSITDIQGKSVYRRTVSEITKDIVIQDLCLPEGIYLVSVNTENAIYKTKLVK